MGSTGSVIFARLAESVTNLSSTYYYSMSFEGGPQYSPIEFILDFKNLVRNMSSGIAS